VTVAAETPRVSVVMPVYNEAENIGHVLREFMANVHTAHELLVVYDVPEDTTVSVVADLLADMPSVRLHRNDRGPGVLNAMLSGIAAARAPLVLVAMADGSDDLRQVDAMVALGEAGADIVAASRYMRGGRHIGGPRVKRLLSRAAGLSLHWIGRVPIHDATNNFKLYRRAFLESVQIESTGGFELAIELVVKATLDGRRLVEVPATWRERTAGRSRFRLRAWLPMYLHWYLYLFRGRLTRRGS
jgi:glycosyltransferase involved in cell wall biosynthesis